MTGEEFWRTVVRDKVDLLGRLIALFDETGIRYCVIGGQAVNAYADPVVSLDLDIVVATEDLSDLLRSAQSEFIVEKFEHSVNLTVYGSDLRVQIQTDPRYAGFPARAEEREVLGRMLPVAEIGDLLAGKVWAVLDPQRRASKRQKDLADISRILEARPGLRSKVPSEVLEKLF